MPSDRTLPDTSKSPGKSVRVMGISKFFGERKILDGLDLDIAPGQLVSVVGSSGSGKTTLLRIIAGFETPNSGRVEIDGSCVIEVANRSRDEPRQRDTRQQASLTRYIAPEKRGVGYLPQEGALFPHLSVRDNIGFGLHRRDRTRDHKVRELIELVGLTHQDLIKAPNQLSGGEQRRVALARALAPKPGLIVLDEPLTGLDAKLRVDIAIALRSILKSTGITSLIVTHDQQEAMSLSDEVAILRDGRIAQMSPPETVYLQPRSLDIANFIGEANVLPGEIVSHDRVKCLFGELPISQSVEELGKLSLSVGDKVDVVIRPEDIELLDGSPLQGGVIVRVEDRQFYGSHICVYLRVVSSATEVIQTSHKVFKALTFSKERISVGDSFQARVQGAVLVFPQR